MPLSADASSPDWKSFNPSVYIHLYDAVADDLMSVAGLFT